MCRKSLLQTKGCLLFIMIFGCVSLWIANKALEQNFSRGKVHCTLYIHICELRRVKSLSVKRAVALRLPHERDSFLFLLGERSDRTSARNRSIFANHVTMSLQWFLCLSTRNIYTESNVVNYLYFDFSAVYFFEKLQKFRNVPRSNERQRKRRIKLHSRPRCPARKLQLAGSCR